MWGGRFAEAPDALLRRFNDSFAFDRELLEEDIEGSIAWASALEEAGVLRAAERKKIVGALEAIGEEAKASALPVDEYEDVHSFVEAKLRGKVGDLAAKLHTGRSRNDQVATSLRLWLKSALHEARELTLGVASSLAARAADEAATPMPSYTHLKQAEPVTFGHWCLAYVEMLLRDASRFEAALERADECPLGSGAVAGTPLEIDRAALARRLGFARPSANSVDAVSDRDAAAEYLFAAALLLSHLSRLAEDLIFFSSDEAAYVELPDRLATGSSRMPQKKNPDVLELVRGHAARAIGEMTGLLALMKGLPLAYNKDLQLDKEPLFRTRDVLRVALPALASLVGGLKLDRERMLRAASSDLLLATQLMDAIASRGVAFRDAHEIVSARVGEALAAGKSLREMGTAQQITAADLEALDVMEALAKKNAIGGTAPARVVRAAADAKKRIGK
jgi:argininosuccinate lyase